MKMLSETDIYDYVKDSRTFNMKDKILGVAKQTIGTTIYHELDEPLALIKRSYKEPVVLKMLSALEDGSLRMIYCDPANSLPNFMPFVKYKVGGIVKCAVDVSYFCDVKEDKDMGTIEYSVKDNRKLYAALVSGYIYLASLDKNTILNANVATYTGDMWSKMFCKVLNKHMSLYSNKDRYMGFRYFAARFYYSYILDMSPEMSENFASTLFKGNEKNMYVKTVEEKMRIKDINPYTSFQVFCETMFNVEITELRAARSQTNSMTMKQYLSNFLNMYDKSALFALASFPYFLYIIISANNASHAINFKGVEDVLVDSKKFIVIMGNLNRDIN